MRGIASIDVATAKAAPGVIAVVTADDLAAVCKPWQTRLALIQSHVSPPQYPLARKEACWQGEAVVAVVAADPGAGRRRGRADQVEWIELPAVATIEAAAASDAALANSAMTTNLGLEHAFAAGDTDAAFRDAAVVVEHDFVLPARPE